MALLQALYWTVVVGLAVKHRKGIIDTCIAHPVAMTAALVGAACIGFTLSFVL
jgi:hypothetical protein